MAAIGRAVSTARRSGDVTTRAGRASMRAMACAASLLSVRPCSISRRSASSRSGVSRDSAVA